MSRLRHFFLRWDWTLLGSVLLLTVFGLAMLYSTSLSGAAAPAGAGLFEGPFASFWKQMLFAGIGLSLLAALAMIEYSAWRRYAGLLYGVAAALLVAVLVFGKTIRGTTGWFAVGGFGIQPVELAKLLLIVYLARCFSSPASEHWRLFAKTGLATAGLFALVALQPDFGSAFLLLCIWAGMLLASRVGKGYLVLLAGVAAIASLVAWAFLLKPYQKDRIAVFWDPARDPLGRGYNVTQSIIAIGSGGLAGKGLGSGSQSQLRFLPERQTDFVFAVIAEELGFLGVTLLMALFGVLLWRIALAVRRSDEGFAAFVAIGIAVSIAAEISINIGSNLRLVPVTGVTLPFLSYGGSSLLVKFMMIGVLLAIASRSRAVHKFH